MLDLLHAFPSLDSLNQCEDEERPNFLPNLLNQPLATHQLTHSHKWKHTGEIIIPSLETEQINKRFVFKSTEFWVISDS